MSDFNSTGLSREILDAVEDLGFTTPTPIQEQAIPLILNQDQDLIALAATGTGKTAAFGLPILDLIVPNNRNVQALVICPTRELCRQIHSDFDSFSTKRKGISVTAVYGGASIQNQIRDLNKGANVVVGTPGRLSDLIQRGKLRLENVQHLVLDEADEMLNMGFKDDIEFILKETPETRATYLFSATMPKEVRRIGHTYLKNPTEISIEKNPDDLSGIEHRYSAISASDRLPALMRILDGAPSAYAIVFCRTRRDTQQVGDKLSQAGYPADCLHGDLSQAQRDHVMQRFRNKRITVLVATDVAARGIDVDDITHVIHFHLPDDPEAYVHRSGRTARAGKSGISIALATVRDKSKLSALSKLIKRDITPYQLPSGEEICQIRLREDFQSVLDIEVDEDHLKHIRDVIADINPSISDEDLINRLLYKEMQMVYQRYENAPDLNISLNVKKAAKGRDKRGKERQKNTAASANAFSRFYINVGKKDDINPNRLMGFINEQNELRGSAIGRIEILKTFSFFELDSDLEQDALQALNGKSFRGRKTSVSLAEAPQKKSTRNKYKDVRFRDKSRKGKKGRKKR